MSNSKIEEVEKYYASIKDVMTRWEKEYNMDRTEITETFWINGEQSPSNSFTYKTNNNEQS